MSKLSKLQRGQRSPVPVLSGRWRWFLLAPVTLISLRAQAPAPTGGEEMVSAQIVAAEISGAVSIVDNGTTRPLRQQDKVPALATVTTAPDANVTLVFSNGTTAYLGPGTELTVSEFLQDPFSPAIKVADLSAEPTISKMKLRFLRGELLCSVKHLNLAQGSSFAVETAGGVIGIRGTSFRLFFQPAPSAQVNNAVLVKTLTGVVTVFRRDGTLVTVPAGTEVALPVTISAAQPIGK